MSGVDDGSSATGGGSTTIDVLANDLLVNALAFSFGTIPCPLTTPADGCACRAYDSAGPPWDANPPDTPCPSGLTTILNYLEGQFTVTVGDPSLSILFASDPPNGTAVISGDEILYTPDPGFCGVDTFMYTAERSGSLDTATVTVNVSAAPPMPQDDATSTPEESPVTIDVLANDGTGISILSVTPPAHGHAAIVAGKIQYEPQPRFEGIDRFTYTVETACGATSTAEVSVDVTHTNSPPTANAGGFYQGIVGAPVELDAGFSSDPDLGDRLEYRWDLDDDGRFDTDWLRDATFVAVYEKPYVGRVTVEVRDLYRGQPTGETGTASALIRIDARQTLQVHVFEDLDADGVWSAGEPSLPGLDVVIAGETLATAPDGRVSVELDAGAWDVALTAASVLALESRGFFALVTELTVDLGRGENVLAELAVIKISTKLKGVVYGDVNENGEYDDEDRVAAGLIVILDGDKENAVVTDETGQFSFRDVPFGDHTLLIQELAEEGAGDPLNLLVPFSLTRAKRPEIFIAWPYSLGPEEGFLQVDVEKGEGGIP